LRSAPGPRCGYAEAIRGGMRHSRDFGSARLGSAQPQQTLAAINLRCPLFRWATAATVSRRSPRAMLTSQAPGRIARSPPVATFEPDAKRPLIAGPADSRGRGRPTRARPSLTCGELGRQHDLGNPGQCARHRANPLCLVRVRLELQLIDAPDTTLRVQVDARQRGNAVHVA